MRVEYGRDTCIDMFQCADEWEGSERNADDGKADLVDGEETDDGVFIREVPEGAEFDARFAARVCPVKAIHILDNDGEQLIPWPRRWQRHRFLSLLRPDRPVWPPTVGRVPEPLRFGWRFDRR